MKGRKIHILLYLFLFFVLRTNAQQDPQFTHYMYSDFLINPGVAGSGGICATGIFRQQWAGFQDTWDDLETGKTEKYSTAPQEVLITFHAPVKALHGGLGLAVCQDKYGYQNDIGVKLAYSFKVNFGGGTLGIVCATFGKPFMEIDITQNKKDPKVVTSNVSDFYRMQHRIVAINPDKGLSA